MSIHSDYNRWPGGKGRGSKHASCEARVFDSHPGHDFLALRQLAPAFRQPFARLSPDTRLAFAWQSATRHTVSSLIARHADEKGARGFLWVSHGLGDMLCSEWSGFCAR